MITDKRKEIATEDKSKQKSQILTHLTWVKNKLNSLSLLTKHFPPAGTKSWYLKTLFSYE